MDRSRILKLGGAVVHVTCHAWPLLKLKRWRSLISSKNAISYQRMVVSTSNLVEVIVMRS